MKKPEIWKDIKGYEELYWVSNLGNVKSKRKVLSPNVTQYGYRNVALCKQGKTETATISRLVAQAFIPNPNNKPMVHHIDSDRFNNRLENLEWVTAKENTAHCINQEKFNNRNGILHGGCKLTEMNIKFIRLVYIPNSPTLGACALARSFGVTQPHITRIIKGAMWRHLARSMQ